MNKVLSDRERLIDREAASDRVKEFQRIVNIKSRENLQLQKDLIRKESDILSTIKSNRLFDSDVQLQESFGIRKELIEIRAQILEKESLVREKEFELSRADFDGLSNQKKLLRLECDKMAERAGRQYDDWRIARTEYFRASEMLDRCVAEEGRCKEQLFLLRKEVILKRSDIENLRMKNDCKINKENITLQSSEKFHAIYDRVKSLEDQLQSLETLDTFYAIPRLIFNMEISTVPIQFLNPLNSLLRYRGSLVVAFKDQLISPEALHTLHLNARLPLPSLSLLEELCVWLQGRDAVSLESLSSKIGVSWLNLFVLLLRLACFNEKNHHEKEIETIRECCDLAKKRSMPFSMFVDGMMGRSIQRFLRDKLGLLNIVDVQHIVSKRGFDIFIHITRW